MIVEASEEKKEVLEEQKIDISKSQWNEEEIIVAEQPTEKKEEKKTDTNVKTGAFVAPSAGVDLATSKVKGSIISGLHCAVGDYESALRMLQKQIALINPAPLKAAMYHIFSCCSTRIQLVSNANSAVVKLVEANGKPESPIKLNLLTSIHKVKNK